MGRRIGIGALVLLASVGWSAPSRASEDCVAPSYVVRTLEGEAITLPARPILRFVHTADFQLFDDESSPVINGNYLDPILEPAIANASAQRLQEEFGDEIVNAMEVTINACHASDPLAFMIATGDIIDDDLLNETRRYIDNLDGVSGADTAYEFHCGYLTHTPTGAPKAGAPACPPEARAAFAIPTGKLVPDSQPFAPDPGDPTYRNPITRTPRQMAETLAASAAGGSRALAPGLPPALRCRFDEPGCANGRLAIPHYAVLGNHDVIPRGTVTMQQPFQAGTYADGRYFFESRREFINEFFFTTPAPGPVGHGFNHVEAPRFADADDRNDGWYAFDAGPFRMIVLDTTYDGVRPEFHRDGDTSAQTGGWVQGNELSDPSGLAEGWMAQQQMEWLEGELQASATRPVIVFGHHPDRSFEDAEAGRTLDRTLGSLGNVVAHVSGHTHENRVTPCLPGACAVAGADAGVAHPFWRVETASLIDWPIEGRIVEVFDLGDGYALRLTVVRPNEADPAVALARLLAEADARCTLSAITDGPLSSGPYDQGRLERALDNATAAAAGDTCQASLRDEGTAADRDVVLLP